MTGYFLTNTRLLHRLRALEAIMKWYHHIIVMQVQNGGQDD